MIRSRCIIGFRNRALSHRNRYYSALCVVSNWANRQRSCTRRPIFDRVMQLHSTSTQQTLSDAGNLVAAITAQSVLARQQNRRQRCTCNCCFVSLGRQSAVEGTVVSANVPPGSPLVATERQPLTHACTYTRSWRGKEEEIVSTLAPLPRRDAPMRDEEKRLEELEREPTAKMAAGRENEFTGYTYFSVRRGVKVLKFH